MSYCRLDASNPGNAGNAPGAAPAETPNEQQREPTVGRCTVCRRALPLPVPSNLPPTCHRAACIAKRARLTGDAGVINLFGRVRQLVSDRAADLPRSRSAERPADGKTTCRGCGTVARLDTFDVCCWWPFGCTTRDDEPYPRLCWDCCDDHERIDLVDIADCTQAATRIRHQS